MKESINNTTRTVVNETPIHAYILWKTGEILGFNMKEAAKNLGIGTTSFRNNMRNRFITKISVAEFTGKLKVARGLNGPESINSDNYERKEKISAKK